MIIQPQTTVPAAACRQTMFLEAAAAIYTAFNTIKSK
jgi:hypothetical protein